MNQNNKNNWNIRKLLFPSKTIIFLFFLACCAISWGSYHLLNKESTYIGGVEFLYHHYTNYLNVGDNIFFKGKVRTVKERWVDKVNNYYRKINADRFKTLVTSKGFVYSILLEPHVFKGNEDLLANFLGKAFFGNNFTPLSNSDLNNLSTKEYQSLSRLYHNINNVLKLTPVEIEESLFIIKVVTKNQLIAERLPEIYYQGIIAFIEGQGKAQLEGKYQRARLLVDSLDNALRRLTYEELVLEDKIETGRFNSQVPLLELEFKKRDKEITNAAYNLSSKTYHRLANEYHRGNSEFVLLNKTFIPFKTPNKWQFKWLMYSLVGVVGLLGLIIGGYYLKYQLENLEKQALN